MWQYATSPVSHVRGADKLRLWIDGVGGFAVNLKPKFAVGGPSEALAAADWSIWSTLLTRHIEIIRVDDGFVLRPIGPVSVAGSLVTSPLPLRHGTTLSLTDTNASHPTGGAGDDSSVRLQFAQPHPLSLTAVLKLVSSHRSVQPLDGVVLLHDTCLVGPKKSHHIVCRDAPGELRLTPSDNGVVCQAGFDFTVDEQPRGRKTVIDDAATIEAEGLRFRVELERGREL